MTGYACEACNLPVMLERMRLLPAGLLLLCAACTPRTDVHAEVQAVARNVAADVTPAGCGFDDPPQATASDKSSTNSKVTRRDIAI